MADTTLNHSRRDFLKTMGLALAGYSIAGCNGISNILSGRAKSKRPNIIFIFADDWGWGDLSCHGHPDIKTPNLDRLASQGTEFYQFTVNGSVCSPSRTAVITGHFPARHRVHQHFAKHEDNLARGMPDWLDPNVVTLPRLLKQVGYKTAHYGKWHLTNNFIKNPPTPLEYGYDDAKTWNPTWVSVWQGRERPADYNKKYHHAYQTKGAVNCAIDFIHEHTEKPFFINLWIHETHTPFSPTPSQRQAYKDYPEPQQTYYSAVTNADRQIGKLLDMLDESGLTENTMVIFSSDNGPERTGPKRNKKLGDGLGTYYSVGSTAGLKGRKRSLFEGGIRLPFIVRWPGKTPVGKIDKTSVITGVDLLPSFCNIAGVKLPTDYKPDGEDITAALLGKPIIRDKPIFWEWRGSEQENNWPRLAIRDGDYKLVMTFDQKRIELYDLAHDREEKYNLAERMPKKVVELKVKLLVWKKTLPID